MSRPPEVDVEAVAAEPVGKRDAAHVDGGDLQLGGVEIDGGEAGVDGREGVVDDSRDGARVEIEADFQPDVADIGQAIAAVVGGVAGEGERAASAVLGGEEGAAAQGQQFRIEGHVAPPAMVWPV